MSENRAKVIAAAITAHSALEALLLELTQEVEEASASSAVPGVLPTPVCTHENKKHLRTFGVAEHWECQDCGYEFRR